MDQKINTIATGYVSTAAAELLSTFAPGGYVAGEAIELVQDWDAGTTSIVFADNSVLVVDGTDVTEASRCAYCGRIGGHEDGCEWVATKAHTRWYYEIQIEQRNGNYSSDTVGPNNEFETYDEAERALEGLRETCPEWFETSHGMEIGARIRLVEVKKAH